MQSRNYNEILSHYILSDYRGVRQLMKDYQKLRSRCVEKSDFEMVDVLIDFASALERAELKPRHREIVMRYLVDDEHYKDLCDEYGISQQYLSALTKSVCEQIAEVYRTWEYMPRKAES